MSDVTRASTFTNPKIEPKEDRVELADPLSLKLDPEEIISRLDERINDSKDWFEKNKNLYTKQQTNKDYLMGKQWDEKLMRKWNARYMNNIIYEAESTIKPIALSRMPDIMITQGVNSDEARADAEALTAIFRDKLKKRQMRQVLGITFQHVPVYYLGAIKPIWNPAKGEHGDYEFNFVHPKLMIIDSMANTLDVTKHEFIGNYWPMTVSECVLRFPKGASKLLKDLGIDQVKGKKTLAKAMATTIKIAEVHFKYLERRDDGQVTEIHAVIWKYRKTFLDMMKDPNWDWEGKERLFYYDPDKFERQSPKQEHLQEALLHNNQGSTPGMPNSAPTSPSGVNGVQPGYNNQQTEDGGKLKKEKIYRNHFDSPRPPYILIGANQWGEMVYDETSRIEQVIPLQDSVNVRGRQITEIANRSRGKEIWALSTGIKKKDIENLDPSSLSQDIVVKGNPNVVHEHVEGDQPKPALFQEMQLNIGYIFSKMGTHDTTRGMKQGKGKQQEQMLLQQDMGRIDDLSEDTINFAVEQMLNWAMQFIKLRYTEDHLECILGPDGKEVFHRVNQDMIHDNMDALVTASGVDRILRKQEAYEKAKMKMIDPLTFLEDLDVSDPKGKAERLYLFEKQPDMWYAKYVKGMNVEQMAQKLGGGQAGQQQQGQQGDPQLAQKIQQIEALIKSPQFHQMPPQQQQQIVQQAKQLLLQARGGQPQQNVVQSG